MQITKIFFLTLFFVSHSQAWFFNTLSKPFVLMIEASGSSTHAGRAIEDSFESGLTYNFAQELKKKLLESRPNTKIILNRNPGQTIVPLQNANYANRLDVDLYMSIHFYHESEQRPQIFIYSFGYKDSSILRDTTLSFCPFDKVYLYNQSQTHTWANQLAQKFVSTKAQIMGPYQLPFKPLIGIKAPAIGIEIGLQKSDDWKEYVELVVQGLLTIISGK